MDRKRRNRLRGFRPAISMESPTGSSDTQVFSAGVASTSERRRSMCTYCCGVARFGLSSAPASLLAH